MGFVLKLNADSASFIYKDMGFLYNDGHYIASVAKNIINGEGVSYWNGLDYRFMDPEISSGPVVFLPLAAALYAGVDEWKAFNTVPIIVNLIIFAVLMWRLSKRTPLLTFTSLCLAAGLICLSFQRWQWRLPLGEVPAALCLLLAMDYYAAAYSTSRNSAVKHTTATSQRSLTSALLFKSGLFWCLALLSKMLVLLSLPVFLLFIAREKNYLQRLSIWLAGTSTPMMAYLVFCFVTMPNHDASLIWASLIDYVFFNFNFGIVDWFSTRAEPGIDTLHNTLQYLHYNLQNLPTIADDIGYIKSSIITVAFLVALCINQFFYKKNEILIPLITAVTLPLMAWYFAVGQHGSRYFFVMGFISVWSLLLLSTTEYLKTPAKALWLNIGIALVFLPLGRQWVFPAVTDFKYIYEIRKLADFLDQKDIPDVLASMTLFHGYPELAYYLEDNRYLIFPGYLDKHATPTTRELALATIEANTDDDQESFEDHPLVIALNKNSETPLQYRWNDKDPGYFLKKVPDYEVDSYTQDCKEVLFQTAHYVLQKCKKSTLSRIVARQSNGRVDVKEILQ
jgi:hypothetical protein